ncbi:MAG: hypothetical protein RLZZ608_168 [Actinomycetota bacterium]|jgi:uncharacterized protein YkwD
MLHTMYAATALTMVMAVTFPFMNGTEAENASIVASGSSSSIPLISTLESWAEFRDSTMPISVYVAHQADEHDDDDETENEGSSPVAEPGANEPGGATPGPTTTATPDPSVSPKPSTTPQPSATPKPSTTPKPTTTPKPSTTPSPAPSATTPPPPVTPVCPAAISGSTPGAPSRTSPLGVAGTTSADLQSFAQTFNAIRVANCLPPVPFGNIRYDSCMEDRLFWMAEDPSTDPMSAWGHIGSVRSDGLASVGCDGNLAGGSGNTGATVAQKWWDSSSHRASLYKPTYTSSTARVCILFAMTHGGVPNEPYSFTRAAARWVNC